MKTTNGKYEILDVYDTIILWTERWQRPDMSEENGLMLCPECAMVVEILTSDCHDGILVECECGYKQLIY